MTPAQFLARLKKGDFAAAYLFLGTESWERQRCRNALIEAFLPEEDRENGITRHDLNETSLTGVIDDARSLSLFAPKRLLLVANAESALPRQKEDSDDAETPAAGSADSLRAFLRNPVPGVVVAFDARRFDFEGEDKRKIERVRAFYSGTEIVELRRLSIEDARREAEAMARTAGVVMEQSALDLVVEALAGNAGRIAIEMEKFALFAPAGRVISAEDVAVLVPDARAATIFVLVGALGRRDRTRGLQVLDTLCRQGEYLPLALSFLSTQFRLALVSKDAGLRSPRQIQSHFQSSGVPMWISRAEQVYQTVSRFSKDQLEKGMKLLFAADRDLRSARPDDRIVMERLVLELTA